MAGFRDLDRAIAAPPRRRARRPARGARGDGKVVTVRLLPARRASRTAADGGWRGLPAPGPDPGYDCEPTRPPGRMKEDVWRAISAPGGADGRPDPDRRCAQRHPRPQGRQEAAVHAGRDRQGGQARRRGGRGRRPRARAPRRRRPRLRPDVRRDRGRDPRHGGRAHLDHDAAHAPDLARHRDRAVRRPARASRARDRQRAAPRARPPRAPRGGAPDPRGLRARRCRARARHQQLEAIADVEALYEDGLLAQAPWLHLELGGAAGSSEHGLAGTPRNLAAPRRRARRHARAAALGRRTARGRRPPRCARRQQRSEATSASGLEDSALLPDGTPATSNGELVELAVALADSLGREPLEPAEARRLFRG